MEISNPTKGYQISLERIKNTLLESLRAGQILQARALTPTHDKQIQLRIGRLDILAHTQARIEAGENLTLQVIKESNPLQLKVIQEISTRNIQAEAMRTALAQQSSISQLMEHLSTLTPMRTGTHPEHLMQQLKQPVQAQPVVAGEVKSVITATPLQSATQAASKTVSSDHNLLPVISSLLQGLDETRFSQLVSRILAFQITPGEKLGAEQIRLAFANSGLFLESALTASAGTPPNDMKRSILELLLQLRPLLAAAEPMQHTLPSQAIEKGADPFGFLTDLVAHAEGGLARILFNQLSSLPGDNNNQQVWQFELPFRQGEKCYGLRVQIERRTRNNGAGQAENIWSVKLDFELEPIGPVHARLALIGEEISSSFTAEFAETANRLKQALPQLATAFSRAGLKVGTLSAKCGSVIIEPRPQFPLLDEKA